MTYRLLIAGAFLLFTTSCTKTFTCGCSDGTPDTIVATREIKAKNKSAAQAECRSTGIECDIM